MSSMNTYEAMFLFDPAAAGDWERTEAEVKRLMERATAELLYCRKWDERRLAYEIDKRKRGIYVLTYFNAPPEKIVDMERDVQLSEMILRVLVLRADDVDIEALNAMESVPFAPVAEDSREYGDRPDRRRGRDDDRDDRRGPRGPRRDSSAAQAVAVENATTTDDNQDTDTDTDEG